MASIAFRKCWSCPLRLRTRRIDTRYTPRLSFVLDLGVKKSIEVSQILQSVLPREPEVDAESPDENDEPS